MPDEDFSVDVYSDAGDGRIIAVQMAQMLDDAVAEAVLELAQEWMDMAQRTVPVQTGYLASTGQVAGPYVTSDTITAVAGYQAPYAREVHELSPHHAQWFAKAGVLLGGAAESRLSRSLRAQLPPDHVTDPA